MLAYAAGRRLTGKRQPSPHALLLVISAHVALLAVVMSAKMEIPRIHPRPIPVIKVPIDPPHPPDHPIRKPRPASVPVSISQPNVRFPLPTPVTIDTDPPVNVGPIVGGGVAVIPALPTTSIALPVHHDPRLLTPASELRPPYPPSKILGEEEATLKLKLTISDAGRVIAVESVGAADSEFLDAARRYLIAHWRYQPATDDGRAVASSTIITLRFQLDG